MSGKYNITSILLSIEDKAKEMGYYSRYCEGLGILNESDTLCLRSNDVKIFIRDYNNEKITSPFYVRIVYDSYDYIGMYNADEVYDMIDKLWTYPKGYIKANFEK